MPYIYSVVVAMILMSQSSPAAATPDLTNGLPEFKCRKQVEAVLRIQMTVGLWKKQAVVAEGTPYRSPTLNFGAWHEVVIRPNQLPVLYTLRSAKTSRFEFDESCQPKTSVLPGLDFSKNSTMKQMNDQGLEEYMRRHKSGLIYVWSPEMIYSVKFFNQFKKVAGKLGLNFLPLVDPRTDDAYMIKISESFGVPRVQQRMNSVELYMRNMTIHYPMSIVFKDGYLIDPVITGVMNEDTLKKQIQYVMGARN